MPALLLRGTPVCQPVLCRVCGKVTWTGCGEHVEQALAGIPHEHRCAGHPAAGRPAQD